MYKLQYLERKPYQLVFMRGLYPCLLNYKLIKAAWELLTEIYIQ